MKEVFKQMTKDCISILIVVFSIYLFTKAI